MEGGRKTESISSKMFDLKFFGIVYDILEWREGVPLRFMNEHESWITRLEQNSREKTTQQMLYMDPNEKAIRHYVRNTYFIYFGFQSCLDLSKGCMYEQVQYGKAWDTE